MDKYQIVEVSKQFNHAGTKAVSDIAWIAEQVGFQKMYIHMNTVTKTGLAKIRRQIGYWKDWKLCGKEITENSIVLLQHPFHNRQLTREKVLYKLKTEKCIHIIAVVHDVEELRGFRYNAYYQHEFESMLNLADVLIVHNRVMVDYFIKKGVLQERIINLEIFDYLQNNKVRPKIRFERKILVAGNLDTKKSKYIEQLDKIDNVEIDLFGPNFDEKLKTCKNVKYCGSFSADVIPHKLTGGFGLVWDGESIDGCDGESGQYLRYNNPHKLSLYLSSGIPVIIWSGAAEADFVKKSRVGICVDSLRVLPHILGEVNENKYTEMLAAVEIIRVKLIRGDYFKKAIKAGLELLNVIKGSNDDK